MGGGPWHRSASGDAGPVVPLRPTVARGGQCCQRLSVASRRPSPISTRPVILSSPRWTRERLNQPTPRSTNHTTVPSQMAVSTANQAPSGNRTPGPGPGGESPAEQPGDGARRREPPDPPPPAQAVARHQDAVWSGRQDQQGGGQREAQERSRHPSTLPLVGEDHAVSRPDRRDRTQRCRLSWTLRKSRLPVPSTIGKSISRKSSTRSCSSSARTS